uniref:Response regulatory domain-containing protein n=1 Tax=Oryza glumipatula TaxID=40148 RepID=A0A0D9ZYU0_9ORYZ
MAGSCSVAGSNKSKLADEEFSPVGMRVLLIDESTTYLKIITKLLLNCGYKGLTVTNFEITYVWRVDAVTPKTAARDAVEELHENPWSYDMVLTEVHAPAGIDGFNLLQYAGTDMDLPVVVFSADDDKRTVLKCVNSGACDYLVKPLRHEELKNIWQHVYRRKLRSGGRRAAAAGNSSKGEIKKRFRWPKELHERFVSIVLQLGVDKATPNQILPLLNREDLTRDQRFRIALTKSKALPSCSTIPIGETVHGIPLALQAIGTGNNQHLIVPFNRITFVRPRGVEICQNGVVGGLVTGNNNVVVPTATSIIARAFGREIVNGADLFDHGTLIRDSSSTSHDGAQNELGETNLAFELMAKKGSDVEPRIGG